MRHTDEEIEQAARRFEQLADGLVPATAEVDRIDDLRQIAAATHALRRDETRQGFAKASKPRGRMAGHGARSLSHSE